MQVAAKYAKEQATLKILSQGRVKAATVKLKAGGAPPPPPGRPHQRLDNASTHPSIAPR